MMSQLYFTIAFVLPDGIPKPVQHIRETTKYWSARFCHRKAVVVLHQEYVNSSNDVPFDDQEFTSERG